MSLKHFDLDRIKTSSLLDNVKRSILRDLEYYDDLSVNERFQYIEIYNYRFNVSILQLCFLFEVSKSGYFYWKRHQNDKYNKDKPLIDAIRKIQTSREVDYTYGVSLMKNSLEYYYPNLLKEGKISKGKVRRLMKENRLEYRVPKKIGYNISNNCYHSLISTPIAREVGERIATDTTEKKSLDNEKIYVSIVIDSASSYILSWKISKRFNFSFIDDSIRIARRKINDAAKTIIHSDHGVHYKSSSYRVLCDELSLRPSMSRKATPTDNGQVENIFSCLVKEKLSRKPCQNLNELIRAINEYFEYYNNRRVHTRLKMTPKDYFELNKPKNCDD